MRIALGLIITALLAGCGWHHGSRYAVIALASSENSGKWLRLDTVTGEMLVCRELPLPASLPSPPAGFVVNPTFTCSSATTSKVINWTDLK